MAEVLDTLNMMLAEVDQVRITLRKETSYAVRNRSELNKVKALIRQWLDVAKPSLLTLFPPEELFGLDKEYNDLLNATEKQVPRVLYETRLKNLRGMILALREKSFRYSSSKDISNKREPAPDFSRLISDSRLQQYLILRWEECEQCVRFRLPLSATVMIGGLLETLFYARARAEPDQSVLFKAKATPRNKDKEPRPLPEWRLNDYIEVGSELKWITDVGKRAGTLLRDYRNYIHPIKQLSDDMVIHESDADIIWEVGKKLVHQILSRVPPERSVVSRS